MTNDSVVQRASTQLRSAVLIRIRDLPLSLDPIRVGFDSSDIWLVVPDPVRAWQHASTSRSVHIVDQHGAGVLEGRLLGARLNSSLVGDRVTGDPTGLGAALRGSIALTAVEQAGGSVSRAWILPDPLGSGMVWRFQSGGVTAISSDLRSLRAVLAEAGIRPQKSAGHAASLIATGGGFVGSSYEAISPLPVASFVVACSNELTVTRYDGVGFDAKSDPDELADRVWRDALSNVRAAANADADGHRIAHLTGGSDSRAVLSTALAAGVAREFAFACGGSRLEPDKQISLALCAEYDLIATDYLGVERGDAPRTFEDATLASFAATDGMLPGAADTSLRPTRNVVMGGAFGEHLKVFYPGAGDGLSPEQWLNDYFSTRILGAEPDARLIAETPYSEIRDELAQTWSEAASFDFPRQNWGDYLYLTRRNRYFMGETIRATSMYTTRIDPLYSTAFMPYVRRSSFELRRSGVPMLDFIARGDSGLVMFPFEKQDIQTQYLAQRGLSPRAFAAGEPWTLQRPGTLPSNRSAWLPEPTSNDVAEARLRRMPIAEVMTYRAVKPRLQSLLSQRRDESSRVVNVDFASELLSRTPGHRSVYRSLTNTYRALLWFLSDTDD